MSTDGRAATLWWTASAIAFAGCKGPQSTLDPAGRSAARIADLFWVMTAGAVVIWAAVLGLAVYAIYRQPRPGNTRYGTRLIVGGGVVLPTVVLTGLLCYGLAIMPPMLAAAPPGSVQISVVGEQYWWRVRYRQPGGEVVELANEIRLPVSQAAQVRLESRDVIHSFWVPALAGKMDAIPGRTTWLALQPTRTGTFRGVCAEYCGSSHAFMGFAVVVQEPEAFARWLAHQAQPAAEPVAPLAVLGKRAFAMNGCGACHTVRGTAARGTIGPDLTHVGSRLTLGAGLLPNQAPHFRSWVAHNDTLKPGVLMPHFGMLPPDQLRALAVYLESLR